ncbi:ATP-binding protein [Candidatus Gracilibacteria bacterium 28_42_T64]|nr:ATP-binding protein [Candidatus Gracilibacteria bacterium 28_42_T64]
MSLTILVGPPCSGKTTYLQGYKDSKIVSSDDEIAILQNNNYTQNELNIIGVNNSYKKINNYINAGMESIVYDSTNLTPLRRQGLLKNIVPSDIHAVNLISDFNNIYSNWENRGKDIKMEMLLYLFIIFKPASESEGFTSLLNIENIQKNDYKNLRNLLEGNVFDKENLLEENKELKILNNFWIKGGKDFFTEYQTKLEFLEDTTLEDRLALLYSDIKYFYSDFIDNLDLTYTVAYDNFLFGCIDNILMHKIVGLKGDKKSVIQSFTKLVSIF